MADKIRWGIIGTGAIARKFAEALTFVPEAELLAVGSRAQASADEFAALFGVPRAYATYEALANDPDVDVVYIATPHPLHKENSLLCLHAGKAVLCEKPFTINAREAEEVIRLARAKRLFLMEAMWTRFLPVMAEVRRLLAEGAIGQVRMITAAFGFRAPFNPQSRLFNPKLGGGALLDVGVYPIALASMIFGSPSRVASMAHIGETGVDEQSAVILGYDGGQLAVLSAALRLSLPSEAVILGTEGTIRIHSPWWRATALTLSVIGKEDEVIPAPFTGNGYNYEAAEVVRCLRAGRLESETLPLDETLSIMRTMDQARAPWGLKYPTED